MEIASVLEASAIARRDWIVFMDIRRRCMHDLAAFGATVWLLALVGRRRQGGMATEIARQARWFGVVWKCCTGC